MSIHIGAKPGQVAKTVLLPGDPLRAKYIAKHFMKDAVCYNKVRNMFGFTGKATATGKLISTQGSGMGMPSLGIYVNELIKDFGVKRIIRVGSAGSLREDLPCRSIVIAQGACSDSALNTRRFAGMAFAPIAHYGLLSKAVTIADKRSIPVTIGNVVSVDKFYEDVEPHTWKIFAGYGVQAIEMETAELYTLGAQYGIETLSILTISDNLVTNKHLSSKEREQTFDDMMEIAIRL